MITISAQAASSLLRGNQRRYVRMESWYDDRLLHDDIPVISGGEEVNRNAMVPERITFSVPRTDRGYDFTPVAIDDPLAANGQRLRVLLGVQIGVDEIEWLQRGWFVITESDPRGDVIEVTAAGLLFKIQEARLVNPFQPSGTMQSCIRRLVEPALTVNFDAAPADRSVPANANYDQDRLQALNITLSAWGAAADVDADGVLVVDQGDDMSTVQLAMKSTTGGTITRKSGVSTREGVYNAVVAQGVNATGGVVRGVAYDYTGPKGVGGPFNELAVPFYFESPLITTTSEASKAANTRLKTLRRNSSTMFTVECVPHPAIQAGDLLTIDGQRVIVEGLNLPYTAEGGAMTLTVRVVT